jgi:hypothetical protein
MQAGKEKRTSFKFLLADFALFCEPQVWLGTSQRALHSLMCRFELAGGINGDPATVAQLARAEEEVARAQKESAEAIARLGNFV